MRRVLLSVVSFLLSAVISVAGTSSVKIAAGSELVKLPHVSATRLVLRDGTSKMYVLLAMKAPEGVVLVDAFGNDGPSLGEWAGSADVIAVKVSFTEGAHENFSLNVHDGAQSAASGGHNSSDGIRGVFKKLEIKGDRIKGTVQHDGEPVKFSGAFDTTFNTIRQPPAITGAAIAASPQGKALLSYAAAMRKLDFATATKFSMNDEVAEPKKMPKASQKQLKELMQMELSSTAAEFEKLLATSSTMTEEGEKTKVEVTRVSATSSNTSTFGLEKVNGVWKVNY